MLPEYGFYSFLAATAISLTVGHVILALHRRTVNGDTAALLHATERQRDRDAGVCDGGNAADDDGSDGDELDDDEKDELDDETEALGAHWFRFARPLAAAAARYTRVERDGEDDDDEAPAAGGYHSLNDDGGVRLVADRERSVRCTGVGQALVAALLLFSLASIVGGAIVDSFTFEFEGAAGWALEALPKSGGDVAGYSLVSLGTSLPDSVASKGEPYYDAAGTAGVYAIEVISNE